MTSTTHLTIEPDLPNQRYLKCVAEGMQEWIDIKSRTGNKEIKSHKKQLQKEITPSLKLQTKLINKMKSLGITKDVLKEFTGTFTKQPKLQL
tara:strand:- start:1731 stop:2006 length:276 start_codon:yes stop_codon:yes gene_type:complete